ncbi:cytotoxic translational repressor of toxin-antitoxin stability system [Nocardia cyriacigeorgica]|uniref:cytotoxic translational repressor of toxin-antitoxin stability system n=1 Tax=Nocardia cyriacigeorgica TaxID=135487 RepID=UPI0018957AF6|nr:cytotoxic translational repressor of toxin-antitoxin stability system [Nocardia cyriacigeorgica]MBF6083513.1 cytotoxic translational repressor of toxin-antitoxin stability system [Nocardia cyriacigeorgica]
MTWPEPTRKRHEQFCELEGWAQVRDARSRTGTHHVTYELTLTDGRILRTRISHPVDRTGYGPSIWSHILRDQLGVTEDELWRCVLDGTPPARSRPETPPDSLPIDLVHLLIHRVGLSESEVAGMNKATAIARLQQFWTQGD